MNDQEQQTPEEQIGDAVQTPDEQAGDAVQTPEDLSVFRNAWELGAAARRKEELAERERQKKEAEAQYQAREEYARELAEEKVDLIRLKQGVISEEDMHFPEEEQKTYTVWQKIGNWFYHAKWWLGIAVFCVLVGGFIIYDYVTHVDPDTCVMVLTDNADLSLGAEQLCRWMEPFCEDYNEDEKILVQAAVVPVSKKNMEQGGNYAAAYNSQLLMQFQSATCMLVIADEGADPYLKPDEMFVDLTELYPECPYAEGCRLKLNGTNFLELAGISGELNPGCYLALRKAAENFNTLEENKEAQAHAKAVLDKIVPLLKDAQAGKEPDNGGTA